MAKQSVDGEEIVITADPKAIRIRELVGGLVGEKMPAVDADSYLP